MTDNTLMPWGLHKGKPLISVPADYLLWLYDNKKAHGDLKDYIKSNLDVLKKEANR